MGLVAHSGYRVASAALCNHVTGAIFAAAALGLHTQLPLDFVKPHASPGMASNFPVGNSAADADDHGNRTQKREVVEEKNYKCE